MRFGEIPVAEAEGAILAHRLVLADGVLRKGTRLAAADLERLRACGVTRIVAALPEPGDVLEDEAAHRIARALAGPDLLVDPPFTGRANVRAATAGVVEIDLPRLLGIGRIDEGLTVATLRRRRAVAPGEMVATVKVVPFALPEAVVALAEAMAAAGGPVLRLRPFRPLEVRLVQTVAPGLASRVLDKTVGTLRARVTRLGGRLLSDHRCPHIREAVRAAVAEADRQGFDMLLVVGASATVDRRDVVPAALADLGARIRRFGLPVDPGNLLLWAELDGRPVLVLPGSARSARRSGVDTMMEWLAAGIEPDEEAFAELGHGGLLAEIPSRPQPREVPPGRGPHRVAAVVLAAGRSTRMGDRNKLLAEVDGAPMVRRVVEAILASRARPVIVVTGHERARVEAALRHLPVTFVANPDHATGMASSLRAGIAAVPADRDGALVCLADMPRLTAPVLDALIEAFHPEEGRAIVVPVHRGRRGHPVLFARTFFPEIMALEGDVGARSVLAAHPEAVVEVAVEDPAVLLDIDTPEALAAARGEGP